MIPLLLLSLVLAACGSPGSSANLPKDLTKDQDDRGGNPVASTDVLLYNGAGVSTSDWQATEQIIRSRGMSYQLINSSELNSMTLEEISRYGVIVIPGGRGSTITSYLSPESRLNLRRAVQEFGVGYVGFCAGAWVAVGPESDTDQIAGYGLAVAPGEVLSTYWPGGNTSLTADIVTVTFSRGTTRQLVWWGGPSTPDTDSPGSWSVIGRYENGKPALSQAYSGRGLVVIAGPHPEAPTSWWLTAGSDPDGLDWDLAARMIEGARTGSIMEL
jgi:glutamine amidotransferase-like uncharacterized protein